MNVQDLTTAAFSGLGSNRLRSFLTILGIVIGITSIILVTVVSRGATNLILYQLQGLGSQTVVILPGREPQGPSAVAELATQSLKAKDVDALKNSILLPGIDVISPNFFTYFVTTYHSQSKRSQVLGAGEAIARIMDLRPSVGAFFSSEDVRQKTSVVVLGAQLTRDLFGESDPIGQKIKIKDRDFRVIGVLPAKGRSNIFDVDVMAIIPYSTLQRYIVGTDYFTSILIRTTSREVIRQTVGDVKTLLRQLHRITDPDKDDFHVSTQADITQRVGIITTILAALLVALAAVSLIVGGVGIMNIMLVAVTERTKEIGLRKAVGATNSDILIQFLLEAVILTFIGGIFGIACGAATAYLATFVLGRSLGVVWPYTFPLNGVLWGLGMAGIVGLIFGIYPARQASKKSPIEALRYE